MPTAIQNLHASEQHDIDVGITAVQLTPAVSKTIYAITIDNTQNSDDVYFKIYGGASSPSVGSDAPRFVLKVPSGQKRLHVFNNQRGKVATTGEHWWGVCAKEGGTATTNPPDEDVKVTVWTN